MQYAMMLWGEEGDWYDQENTAAIEAAMNAIYAWMSKWQAAGKIADGGAELDSIRTAKTVSRGPDGKPMVTDGPFLELKEVIGGFLVLEADDIDEAVAIAAEWPGVATHGDRVEVRPVIQR
jgi:hypothetical protein